MGKLGKTGGLARKVIVAMTIKRPAVGTIAMAFLLLHPPLAFVLILGPLLLLFWLLSHLP